MSKPAAAVENVASLPPPSSGSVGGGADDDTDSAYGKFSLASYNDDSTGAVADEDDDFDDEETEVDENEELHDLVEGIGSIDLKAGHKKKKVHAKSSGSVSSSSSLGGKKEGDVDEGLERLAQWWKDGECRKVVVLSGAGVSCSAGIPDFRSPGTGLYDNLQKYNLPYPEAVFDLRFYRTNSTPFVSLAKEIWPGQKHSPTPTHSFVTLLEKKGYLLRNYTQNIDGLEVLSGTTEDKLVECHGHFRSASCIECTDPYDGIDCKRLIVNEQMAPTCLRCGGKVKPDIVFFGEGLPDRFAKLLRKDLENTDLLIVMGTSLTVAPVSLIPEMVGEKCRRVLLNREVVGDFVTSSSTTGKGGGGRDVVVQGDCDDAVTTLCKLMGWEDELMELNESSRITPKKK